MAYRFAAPDTALRDAVASELEGESARAFAPDVPEGLKWQALGAAPGHLSAEAAALRRVAPYADVDGAVVITRDLEVLGFGAKIIAANDMSHVLVGDDAMPVEDTGGTRHQSAARFVGKNPDCAATVISHDGHISLLHWDGKHRAVRLVRNVEWWD
jgi:DNA integrity scanning protein DisA with diadenylate cyclase activity